MATYSSILAQKIPWTEELGAGCSRWGPKELGMTERLPFLFLSGGSVVKNLPAMRELQEMTVQSLGRKDSLEEGMATHFRILAWRIPWTEVPGRQQSTGSQRVRHD